MHRILSSKARLKPISVLGVIGLSAACLVITATPALAYSGVPSPTPHTFVQCPVNGSIGHKHGDRISTCVLGVASEGTIDIGGLDTTFAGPARVDFGYAGNSGATLDNTVGALNGKTYTAPKQLLSEPVMTLIGNPAGVKPPGQSQVYVTTTLVGPITFNLFTPGSSGINPEVIVPLVFRFVNPLLGSGCALGSVADPVTLTLTTGTSGALTGTLGTFNIADGGSIAQTIGTEVVDGMFSVPGVTGCGSGGVFDDAINTLNNLPSPSGANEAILYGTFDLAASNYIKKQLHE
jgi:hypothetical protein